MILKNLIGKTDEKCYRIIKMKRILYWKILGWDGYQAVSVIETGQLYRCAKPFRIQGGNTIHAVICDYIT